MEFSNLTCQVFVFFIGYFCKRRGKWCFSLFTAVGNHYSPIKGYLGSWNVGVPYGLHAPWLFIWLNHIFLAYLEMQWMKIRGLLWAVCLCEGWTRVFCLVGGFIWVEEWPSGRIVFSREWKAVGLLKPACQRTNCRSNVGKEGTHRKAFKWGNEEVMQDKHPTSSDLLKKTPSLFDSEKPQVQVRFYCHWPKYLSWPTVFLREIQATVCDCLKTLQSIYVILPMSHVVDLMLWQRSNI